MKTCSSIMRCILLALLPIFIGTSCKKELPEETPLTVREYGPTAYQRSQEAVANTPLKLHPGIAISLWASDSLAPDPVAMSISDQGHVYLTRTNRRKSSELDIRAHSNWMIHSISFQTVEDRRAFIHSTLSPEFSAQNQWLEDTNNDGLHDWHDLTVEKEEVWKIVDEDGDGIADVSKRVVNDFNNEVTEVAGALLVRQHDMFVGVGPDMWHLEDTNGDEVFDKKESISTGYAVHIGFGSHGMSGAVEGPDGRIYWGIGDIGAHITAKDGSVFKYPHQGVIVRSEPDGSCFEVFAAGLRNTHEFVFDTYGNIISSDNDGDHQGESERLVHIVQGHDAGWRTNWQYGKYADQRNNTYKVWMDERLHEPRWEGQAAYIIPPIASFHNGPAGMAFNPGTALGPAWKNHFFLVEFAGDPGNSPIWAFTLTPNGASFALEQEKILAAGILPTAIRFGPDGALYAADWINGWNTKNYGRVWKIDVQHDNNDWQVVRQQTRKLITLNYPALSEDRLYHLLAYADMRVRQKSQFELVRRGKKGAVVLQKAVLEASDQLAKIHGIWGLGQLGRQNAAYAAPLLPLLLHKDPEIATQAAKTLGDIRFSPAGASLTSLLTHAHPRVRFYAAEAIGRIKYEQARQALLRMIEENNNEDVYIRHAGVLALARLGQPESLAALATSPAPALRLAAVLALRRLGSEKISVFLNDSLEYIVAEAARAINDDWSIPDALPALAATLSNPRFTSEPLLRRGINAALRVGGERQIALLINFAGRAGVAPALRAESLNTIGTWPHPSVLDRVDGYYRGEIKRPAQLVQKAARACAAKFLSSPSPEEVVIAAANMLAELQITDFIEQQASLMHTHPEPGVRTAMLHSLHRLGYANMSLAIKTALNDKDRTVRAAALGMLGSIQLPAESLPGIINPIFTKGTLTEQQEALKMLGNMPAGKSQPILTALTGRLLGNQLNKSLTLDLLEAVEKIASPELLAQLKLLRSADIQSIEAFRETLHGGDAQLGSAIFYTHPAAQCIRCHIISGKGSTVGPKLAGIGSRLSREQILQALIEPGARLAPGYGSVMLALKDGQKLSGTLLEETTTKLTLKTSEAEPMQIARADIVVRKNSPSAMPPMGTTLTRREIRDVVEFLATLK